MSFDNVHYNDKSIILQFDDTGKPCGDHHQQKCHPFSLEDVDSQNPLNVVRSVIIVLLCLPPPPLHTHTHTFPVVCCVFLRYKLSQRSINSYHISELTICHCSRGMHIFNTTICSLNVQKQCHRATGGNIHSSLMSELKTRPTLKPVRNHCTVTVYSCSSVL